jgi:hypothetical protein
MKKVFSLLLMASPKFLLPQHDGTVRRSEKQGRKKWHQQFKTGIQLL